MKEYNNAHMTGVILDSLITQSIWASAHVIDYGPTQQVYVPAPQWH